ncbi:hypothetical protein GCM10007916_04040 [Psychromonas marina]|uniref:Uncharacterized protein n=1 Tax=Psychromonas marina TaxID=88364 RepID=A0ABQ6DWB1_9GAMM|nr:hypothetical protein [Psychromonas marina]GLS89337.1 hypothetical protein GCM10007916_04040 [Psychromonas marina]
MIIKILVATITGLAGLFALTIYALITYGGEVYNALEDGSLNKIQTSIENVQNNIESVIENTEQQIQDSVDNIDNINESDEIE